MLKNSCQDFVIQEFVDAQIKILTVIHKIQINEKPHNQMFDSKYKMKNVKKTQPQRFPSVQLKKAVSVIKCFICNQMFYSQPTFDEHMKHHSSKLNRQVPQQIQRKKMQSFRVNKNKTNSNFRGSTALDKKLLNQTASLMRPKIEETENKPQEQQIKHNKQQIEQAQQALKESTILIQKIQALTHDDQSHTETPKKIQPKIIQKNPNIKKDNPKQYTQQQLITIYLQGSPLTVKMIQQTNFQNQYLISCHDQLTYLNQLIGFMENANTDFKRVEKMKKQILAAVIQYFKQNTVQLPEVGQNNSSNIYITNNNQANSKKSEIQIIENTEISYCNQCYMQIQFGEECYQDKEIEEDNRNKYHIECWEQFYGIEGKGGKKDTEKQK